MQIILFLLVFLTLVPACGSGDPEEFYIRDDMNVTIYQARVDRGLSERIHIEIPSGVDSFLIEVRGNRGLYYLTEFVTPKRRDLIEGGKFITRGAREIPGLVDWIYPNDPSLKVEKGTYQISIRGVDAYTKNKLSEDIEVLIYTPKTKPEGTCGINIDFLVDDAALGINTFKDAVESITDQVNLNLRQVGIKVKSTITYRVNMQSSDINLGDGSATKIVDDVLDKTRRIGAARENALHVLVVRRIGGNNDGNFDPAGYSMGLPGPYAADRNTAAVLVSTEFFASNGQLDAPALASTVAHEIGHYLGLYHTSERSGDNHDPIDDTPECSSPSICSEDFRRNIMTSSFWLQGGPPSYRNQFTSGQGEIMRGHPLCEPMPVEPVGPPAMQCTKSCTGGNTCALHGGSMTCEPACDPNENNSCATGTCSFDDIGTYICK